jgi:hypothetical protein
MLVDYSIGLKDRQHVGPRHKRHTTPVWVPIVLVTNVKGLKQVWVPKNKA